MFSQAKTIKLFDNKYVYFSLKKNFMFQTIANKVYSVLKPGLVQLKSNIISDVPSRNSYSTIMFTTTLPNQMQNLYFYHVILIAGIFPRASLLRRDLHGSVERLSSEDVHIEKTFVDLYLIYSFVILMDKDSDQVWNRRIFG